MATIQEIFNSVYQAAATLLKIGGGAADDAAAAGNPVLTAGKYSAAPATRHDGDAVTQQMTATGAAHVAASGMAAHDAAAAGNPVQVGGVYRVADPALADGDVGSLRVNAKGEALMQLTGSIIKEIVEDDPSTIIAAGGSLVYGPYDCGEVARITVSLRFSSQALTIKVLQQAINTNLAGGSSTSIIVVAGPFNTDANGVLETEISFNPVSQWTFIAITNGGAADKTLSHKKITFWRR